MEVTRENSSVPEENVATNNFATSLHTSSVNDKSQMDVTPENSTVPERNLLKENSTIRFYTPAIGDKSRMEVTTENLFVLEQNLLKDNSAFCLSTPIVDDKSYVELQIMEVTREKSAVPEENMATNNFATSLHTSVVNDKSQMEVTPENSTFPEINLVKDSTISFYTPAVGDKPHMEITTENLSFLEKNLLKDNSAVCFSTPVIDKSYMELQIMEVTGENSSVPEENVATNNFATSLHTTVVDDMSQMELTTENSSIPDENVSKINFATGLSSSVVDYKSQVEISAENNVVNLPIKVNEDISECASIQTAPGKKDKNIIEKELEQIHFDKDNTKIDEKINFVPEDKNYKDYWKCADPTCKSLNAKDSKICEKCSLSNMFKYEKCGKFGKGRTIVKNKIMESLDNKKWLVVHSSYSTVFLRNHQMQKDFVKFSDSLNQYLKDSNEMTKVNSSFHPVKGDVFIMMSEGIPYRVRIEEVSVRKPKSQSLGADVKNYCKVFYEDVGKIGIVSYDFLVKLARSSFSDQKPFIKACFLNNISFRDASYDQRVKMDAWIRQQLVNKSFNMQMKDLRIKHGNRCYVDIFLDGNNQNFRHILAKEFANFSEDHEKLSVSFENKSAKSVSSGAYGLSQPFVSGAIDEHAYTMESKDFQHHMPKPSHYGSQPPYYQEAAKPSYSNWNSTSSQYWQNQAHSIPPGYYGNPQASLPFVATTAYNTMNKNFCSIPAPPSNLAAFVANLRPSDEESSRKIAILEGELQAYKDQIGPLDSSFTATLKKFFRQSASIQSKRSIIDNFMIDKSPLSRAISMLLKDFILLSHLDSASIIGKEIKESTTKTKINLVHKYKDILNPLKLHDKLKSLEHLISELEKLQSIWYLASNHCDNKYSSVDDAEKSFEEFCSEYMSLKKSYFIILGRTNKAVDQYDRLISCYNIAISNNFKCVGSNVAVPTDFLALKDALDDISKEDDFTTKMKDSGRVWVIIESVLEEMTKRRKKILEVEVERSHIESISLESEEISQLPTSIIKDEHNLVSLLDFVRTSKKMSQSFKYMVVMDIFRELLKNHQKNKIYFYVNPVNILINSGATLCSQSSLTMNEPIPPFQFLAPECHSLQPDILILYRGEDYANFNIEDSVVGPAADCYSLGQLIQWIYCVDAPNSEFIIQMLSVMESHPVMRKLVDPSPKERPSLENLDAQGLFKELLKNIFGDCDIPEKDNHDLPIEGENVVEAVANDRNLPIVEKHLIKDSAAAFTSQCLYSSPSSNLPRIDSDNSLLSRDTVDVVKDEEDDIFEELSDPSISEEVALLYDDEYSD